MQGRTGDTCSHRRALRAGIASPGLPNAAPHGGGRVRRGTLSERPQAWRRTEPGSNHIACFGIWRPGSRRQAVRTNRFGITRWHMPHRKRAFAMRRPDGEAMQEETAPGQVCRDGATLSRFGALTV